MKARRVPKGDKQAGKQDTTAQTVMKYRNLSIIKVLIEYTFHMIGFKEIAHKIHNQYLRFFFLVILTLCGG